MRKFLIIVLLSSVVFSCRTRQVINNTSIDTVFIDRKIVVEEKVRVDTVVVELPSIESQVVKEDSSFLSNKYATTLAYIQSDGLLFHNLNVLPQKIKAPVLAIDRIETKDSVYVKIQKVVAEVPVKMPIPKWKQILMWIGVVAIAFVLYKISKMFTSL